MPLLGPDLTMFYNDAYAPMLGKKQNALGSPFAKVWQEIWDEVKPFADKALSGESVYHKDLPLIMTRNGYEEETFWTFSYSPLYNDDGSIAGLINVTVETTETVLGRRWLEEKNNAQEVLKRELMHRVKNTMSVTSAVVNASMRHSRTIEEARKTVSQRIRALSDAQDILNRSSMAADVHELVSEALAPHLHSTERARLEGPPILISSQQAVGLSLAVYELATNAIKYGALSTDSGIISVEWSIEPDDKFRFVWKETGGPRVSAPDHAGFGSRLTNQIVASYFSGEGTTTFEPDGLLFVLEGTAQQNDDSPER